MTINTYLEELGSSLVMSEGEKSSVATSITTLESRLDSYFDNLAEDFAFGSYTRRTILPRSADERSDIDYMVVFNDGKQYTPQTCLNRLKSFAEYYYRASEIHQSSPTMVLELNHIKFELVPAYAEYGAYYIPDGRGGWMFTSPNNFNKKLTEANNNNSHKVKPTVRLVKYWNIVKNDRDLASFEMEQKIADLLYYPQYGYSSYTDYLLKTLKEFYGHFYLYGYTTSDAATRTSNAISRIQDAVWYENNNQQDRAMQCIKSVFPEL